MSIKKRNPCYGCTTTGPEGETRRAACCWDTRIEVDTAEYLRLFLKHFKKGAIICEESYDHRTDQMFFIITTIGACPYLIIGTGECRIHRRKPTACKKAEPGKFALCILET